MKRFISLMVLLISTSVSAFNITAPRSEFIDSQAKEHQENAELTKRSTQASFNQLDSHWMHEITAVNEKGDQIQLKNGVILNVGWWWQSKVKKWEKGDLISLTYNFNSQYNFLQLFNGTKNQTAWGNFYSWETDSPNATWIASFEEHRTVILLNNGLRVKGGLGSFTGWHAGDLILTISLIEDHERHSLWNIHEREIATDLTVAQEPQ